MKSAKSTAAVFAALIALGATLDAHARNQGGGMEGGQGGGMGSSQMSGQGSGQHGSVGSAQQKKGQGSGGMTRERTQTREQTQTREREKSGTPDMQQDMIQRRTMTQEQRQINQAD